jgi:hypothetical protein
VTSLKLGLLRKHDDISAKMRAKLAEAFPAAWMHVVKTGKATGAMDLGDVREVMRTVEMGRRA